MTSGSCTLIHSPRRRCIRRNQCPRWIASGLTFHRNQPWWSLVWRRFVLNLSVVVSDECVWANRFERIRSKCVLIISDSPGNSHSIVKAIKANSTLSYTIDCLRAGCSQSFCGRVLIDLFTPSSLHPPQPTALLGFCRRMLVKRLKPPVHKDIPALGPGSLLPSLLLRRISWLRKLLGGSHETSPVWCNTFGSFHSSTPPSPCFWEPVRVSEQN